MRRRFVGVPLQNLFKTYILQVPRGSHKEFNSSELHQKPYQDSILHEIQTEDGFIISCKQWKGEKKLHPVLLINGHSTENYWLPTEPNDLVRTLEEGHETWLLQPRLHPLNPSNNFTIEDIGRFDIPAVINKIRDLHGPLIKIHVVAHCVGGLAIHVALMGGHASAAHIASLSCTNSSMFFKLTTSSRVKMWLPLFPMSMVILGKNKILPSFKTSKASSRQKLLKTKASNECEVFSGIFGNTFWHDNISPSMHYWLNKQSLPRLPMAGFPHLGKICNAGFIVDSSGKNSYLIHPERMALPTLYISGGRTLLVTPQTTLLATNCMKLHQSGFRHETVVVDGFGHSDLLIGEESYKKVFSHILSHIRLAEEEKNCLLGSEKRKYNKEPLAWGGDPLQEGNGGLWSYISPLVATWLLFVLLLLAMVVYFFH